MKYILPVLIILTLAACSGSPAETIPDEVIQTTTIRTQEARPVDTKALTKTLISLITAFGQEQEIGQWKIMIVNSDLTDTITTPEGSYISSEGRALYLVELEIKNTVKGSNTLQVDPHELEVVDLEGESYMSIGVAPVYDTFLLHIYHVGGSIGLSAEQDNDGPTVTLKATAIDENTKEWKIELSDEGSAKITIAFEILSDVQVKELHWPGLYPFSLEE